MEENQNSSQSINLEDLKTYKLSVEIGESAKKEKYIKSIKVRSDDINELADNLAKVKVLVEEIWKWRLIGYRLKKQCGVLVK